jgi:uncharacterized protein YbcI
LNDTQRVEQGSMAARVSTDMVQLMSRYTGRGPTKARTTLNTNVVAVIFQDTLTKAEQNLVAAGQMEAVHHMRRTFHELMREDAVAIIEDRLGRKVAAFLSDLDPEANMAGNLFILEPEEDGDGG